MVCHSTECVPGFTGWLCGHNYVHHGKRVLLPWNRAPTINNIGSESKLHSLNFRQPTNKERKLLVDSTMLNTKKRNRNKNLEHCQDKSTCMSNYCVLNMLWLILWVKDYSMLYKSILFKGIHTFLLIRS